MQRTYFAVCRRRTALSCCMLGLAFFGLQSLALGQLVPGTQIQTAIRPGVWIQYSGGAGTAVGIYDSGDPADTFSRDTALGLNIPPTTPTPATAANANYYNQGTTAVQALTSGGWLGATLQGPDVPTPAPPANYPDTQIIAGNPSHVFTTANTARTSPVASNGIQPWYLDYNAGTNNNGYSENHTGQSFVTAANAANDLAVVVDPINGSPLPFAYDNVRNLGAGGGGNNGRQLNGASIGGNPPLDATTSSVTYLQQGNARIPSLATIADPGFTYNVELIPQEFPSTLSPVAANVNLVNNLPVGVTRQMVIQVSNAVAPGVNGIVANNSYPPPNGTFSPPTYLPAQLNGAGQLTGIWPTTSFTYNVSNAAVGNNANLADGSLENRNGFVRTNGSVQVVVQNAANGNNVPNFNGGNPMTVTLPSQAPDPYAVVSGTGMGATSFLWDTGAPNTSVSAAVYNALAGGAGARILPQLNIALIGGGNLTLNNVSVISAGANGTPIIGTNVTNEFGQVWNYAPVGNGVDPANPNRGALTLTGPAANPYAQSLMGNGIIFAVDPSTTGMVGTGVNQLASYGNVPALQPGNGAPVGGGNTAGAAGTVYRTDLTGSNASYITTGASGLAANEVMTGLSLGKDLIGQQAQLFFTVSSSSDGQAGSAVQNQQLSLQAGASIYTVPMGQPSPNDFTAQSNSLLFNHELLGLGQTIGPNAAAGTQSTDQLRDFKINTQLALPAVSLSNLDPAITQVGDTGTAARPRVGNDVLGTSFDTYFTTNQGGPTIYKDNKATIFASGPNDIGLEASDQINSLAVFRPSVAAGIIGAANVQRGTNRFSSHLIENADTDSNTFDPNIDDSFDGIDAFHGGSSDLALFTLAPGSPSLTAYEASLNAVDFGRASDILSPSDVFITDFDGTFTLFSTAESLGLLPSDVIQGLDVVAVPEPATIGLFVLGVASLLPVWRRRLKIARPI